MRYIEGLILIAIIVGYIALEVTNYQKEKKDKVVYTKDTLPKIYFNKFEMDNGIHCIAAQSDIGQLYVWCDTVKTYKLK